MIYLQFNYQQNIEIFNSLYRDVYLDIYANSLAYTQTFLNSSIANYPVNAQAKGVTLSADGTKAFIAEGTSGLTIVDITNPINPTKITQFDTSGTAYRVALSNDETKVFISDGSNGLVIVDISDLDNLKKIGEFTQFGNILDVALSQDNTKAFLASSEGIVIVDILDPTNPTEVAIHSIGGAVAKLVLSNDGKTIFAVRHSGSSNDGGGLYVIDVGDSSSPNRVDFQSITKANDVELSPDGTRLLVSSYDTLWRISLEENNTIGFSLFVEPDSSYGMCFVDENQMALVANGSNGLAVFQGSEIIKKFKTKNFALDVKLSTDKTKAFVADNEGGLEIIDLSGLVDSSEITHYNEKWGSAEEIILSKDEAKAFIAYKESGLLVLDTSKPKDIKKISQFETIAKHEDGYRYGGKAKGVILSRDETKAFVADDGNGLFILDITDPQNPIKIGHYLNEEMNNITSVVLSSDETKAYLSNMWGNNGLVILDISDPTNPQEISYVETVGYANQVVISKDEMRAYI